MSRQGTYISFADTLDGADTRIVTEKTPLPVTLGDTSNAVPLPTKPDATTESIRMAETLAAILGQMELLNTRFEEAFRTGVNLGDMNSEN